MKLGRGHFDGSPERRYGQQPDLSPPIQWMFSRQQAPGQNGVKSLKPGSTGRSGNRSAGSRPGVLFANGMWPTTEIGLEIARRCSDPWPPINFFNSIEPETDIGLIDFGWNQPDAVVLLVHRFGARLVPTAHGSVQNNSGLPKDRPQLQGWYGSPTAEGGPGT